MPLDQPGEVGKPEEHWDCRSPDRLHPRLASLLLPLSHPPLTVIDWPLPLSPRLADLLLRALALCHQQPAPPALLLPRSAVGFKRSVVRVALAWPNLP